MEKEMKTKSRISAVCAIAALLLSAMATPAATITVTNGNDSGPGSLRQAILSASSGDTINFAPCLTTVTLTSGELVINKNLTITGPGAGRLTVQRSTSAGLFRIFHITSSTVTVSISGVTISNGVVAVPDPGGGGIRSAGALTLTDSVISSNSVEFATIGGGGVVNENGTMTITRCTISNNSASAFSGSGCLAQSSFGGGILNQGGSMIITDSTISGNSCFMYSLGICPVAADGGGIYNAGSISITNCTISGNAVSQADSASGGGIFNTGNLQIRSSTIAHNLASGSISSSGGGIYSSVYSSAPTRTDSSIIALNTASTGPDFTGGGGLQSVGYNIIGNNADAVISSQPTDQIGTPTNPIDPLLGPLTDNGGPTSTHALQAGSPAINRGDPAAPPHDQRGYGRAAIPDVGAFEYGGAPPATLGNISTRAFVQTGDNVVIGGFMLQGIGPKRVIIRAIGPELTQYGVPNALANPRLELHDCTGALIASNDNWQFTIIGGIITHDQGVEIRDSGYAPGNPLESAIIADLPPGNYTAIVRGVNNITGVALVEAYDLSPGTNSILGNTSTRSFVQTGDNVMIGGFIVQGTDSKRVIIRAIGPELSAPPFNIPNALANPTLELHDSTGALIASNDNWQFTIIGGIITSDQGVEIRQSGHAPGNPLESAIIADLPVGNYTAIVRGVNNTTGVALVEVYDLDQ